MNRRNSNRRLNLSAKSEKIGDKQHHCVDDFGGIEGMAQVAGVTQIFCAARRTAVKFHTFTNDNATTFALSRTVPAMTEM